MILKGLRLIAGNVVRSRWEKCGMRWFKSLVPALALFVSSSAMAQSSYPDRPIRMIVPLAAASALDVAARVVT